MTVAAYRDGVLASDRAVSTMNDLVFGYRTKIRATNGKLIATCGMVQNGVAFQEWFEAGEPPDRKPVLDKEFTGLVIEPNGTIKVYNNELYAYVSEGPYYAIGNGDHVAMGAMHAGATAEGAVQAAIDHVLGCGGGIDVLRLATSESAEHPAHTNQTSTMGT